MQNIMTTFKFADEHVFLFLNMIYKKKKKINKEHEAENLKFKII